MHLPWNEISLIYKSSKNCTPSKEIATLLFSLKLGVFKPSITMPYGPHKKGIYYLANNDEIYKEHTPLQVPPF
jgi:hypothetical protein